MNEEIILDDKDFLISETDKKGVITHANKDFLRISGYTLEELLNHSHNIMRHEDMPAIVFKEMWDTIKQGETWSGYVKNRAKSGNYYWVKAVISSLHMDDGSIGYISCRKKASREKIKEAEKLYKEMR